ncbi:MAG: Pr6Pr family membrane protein [Paracoccaceae bacterium]
MNTPVSHAARLGALIVFVVAALSLRLQFDASRVSAGNGSAVLTLFLMSGYFTVLTNLLVAIMMGLVAMRWRVPGAVAFAGVLAIVMVGLVYHTLLAGLTNPQALAWWADQGLHTAVPVLTLAWWLLFAPVPRWQALTGGLIWPLVYLVYALARGVMTGLWPYPFLNVARIGWGGVALNSVGMMIAFVVAGAVLIALKRRLG